MSDGDPTCISVMQRTSGILMNYHIPNLYVSARLKEFLALSLMPICYNAQGLWNESIEGLAIHANSSSIAIIITSPTTGITPPKFYASLIEDYHLFALVSALCSHIGFGLERSSFPPSFQINPSLFSKKRPSFTKRLIQQHSPLMRF